MFHRLSDYFYSSDAAAWGLLSMSTYRAPVRSLCADQTHHPGTWGDKWTLARRFVRHAMMIFVVIFSPPKPLVFNGVRRKGPYAPQLNIAACGGRGDCQDKSGQLSKSASEH